MELINLHDYTEKLMADYNYEYFAKDRVLPAKFKQYVLNHKDGQKYHFQTNSVVIKSDLTIFCPNQWFYIAAYYCQLYPVLKQYREIVIDYLIYRGISSKELQSMIQSFVNNEERAKQILGELDINEDDYANIIKFVTDYNWWRGGKSIERQDFYYSPILASAKLVNQSQAYVAEICKYLIENPEALNVLVNAIEEGTKDTSYMIDANYSSFLTALRTKPFLLLAGISGTGKSQKVQELAFMTCPKNDETHNLRDPKSTTPGNYQLVEVKPNWHDSTELLGYYSALSGKYELTDFIRFTYKALQNTDVPFFLCLDEMNLAPVEQYFAEFLSVLETRKKTDEGIKTQPLLTKDKFSNCELMKKVLVKEDGDILEDGKQYKMEFLYSKKDSEIIEYLKVNGLHLPDNLFVIGTVNMDDTTHQFSRKVIDRAFTIEMNGGKMSEMFTAASKTLLEYREEPLPLAAFQSRFVRAYEVLDDAQFSKYAEKISKDIPALLGDSDGTAAEDSINGILNNTPFRVSYRVQNELVLYLSVLIENAGFPDEIDGLIGEATLAILLEKVLPRVQGEQKQLETKGGKSNILKDMTEFVKRFAPTPDENGDTKENPLYTKVVKKLEEMDGKLTGYYTNFF